MCFYVCSVDVIELCGICVGIGLLWSILVGVDCCFCNVICVGWVKWVISVCWGKFFCVYDVGSFCVVIWDFFCWVIFCVVRSECVIDVGYWVFGFCVGVCCNWFIFFGFVNLDWSGWSCVGYCLFLWSWSEVGVDLVGVRCFSYFCSSWVSYVCVDDRCGDLSFVVWVFLYVIICGGVGGIIFKCNYLGIWSVVCVFVVFLVWVFWLCVLLIGVWRCSGVGC